MENIAEGVKNCMLKSVPQSPLDQAKCVEEII